MFPYFGVVAGSHFRCIFIPFLLALRILVLLLPAYLVRYHGSRNYKEKIKVSKSVVNPSSNFKCSLKFVYLCTDKYF